MSDETDRYRTDRDVWSDHVRRQEFEHELINRKTTWLMTTQAILFAAYGVTFDSRLEPYEVSEFRNVLAYVGAVVGFVIFVAVVTLTMAKRCSWKDYQVHYEKCRSALPQPLRESKLQWGVRTKITYLSLLPDLCLPLLFAGAWVVIRLG